MNVIDWVRGLFGKDAKRDPFAGTYGTGTAGGFAGGAVNRLTASMATWAGSVNHDLDGSLVILRARARQLAQNNEYGRRFLSQVATNVVGPAGPVLQVRATMAQPDKNGRPVLDKSANDAVEIHYKRWCKSADIAGKMDFAMMLRVAVKGVARDGEALVRLVRNRSLPYGFAVQLLESDRIDEALNSTYNGRQIRQGVEMESTGKPVAYWIKSKHPGEVYKSGAVDLERVPASDIIHLFLPERAEQVRGYTWFHAILLRASQLHGFNDAAVLAARIGASKIAALEQSEDALQPDRAFAGQVDATSGNAMHINVEAGELFELPPGYKLSSWNPEYPHANYESFVKAAMRGISAGLDVATHNLSGDMTDVNYSSARIAELAEREVWVTLQGWLINSLVLPVYKEWLAISMLRGDITFEQSGKSLPADKLQKFSDASRFQGRRWRWVDPQKEIEAFSKAIDLGVTSRTRIAAEQGDDFDDLMDELQQEGEQMSAAGLKQEAPAPAAPDNSVKDAALAALARSMEPREQQPIVVNVAPANLTVNQAEIKTHIDIPPTTINQPEIRNEITIEPTPIVAEVNVEVPPPEVRVQLPARKTETTIVRDSKGEISSATQIETDVDG